MATLDDLRRAAFIATGIAAGSINDMQKQYWSGVASTSPVTYSRTTTTTGAVTEATYTQNLAIAPATDSGGTLINGLFDTTYTGAGTLTGTGHGIGLFSNLSMNSTGVTVPLLIALEGKFIGVAGRVTSAVSVHAGFGGNAVGSTVDNWVGSNVQVTSNLGTFTNCIGHDFTVLAATSQITTVLANRARDVTAAQAASYVGYYSLVSAKANHYGFYSSGTAQNSFIGNTYIGAAASSGNGAKLEVTGVIEHIGDRAVRFTTQTSSAGAFTGTLSNAPAAGNPLFWLRVVINGTNGAIPVWAG